jgi:glyoxylase-like metal-dependent hydrolase (beta-lactamase superfamily II)
MQLAPSLHRLGSSSLVNSYLIEDAGTITVIDAGLRGHWKDLLRELEAMGRSPVDIRALLLTHGGVGHRGFAERLRQEHGVLVFVGAADAAEARGEVPKPAAVRDRMRIMLKFLVYGLTQGGLRSTPSKISHRSIARRRLGPALAPFTIDPAKALVSLDALDGVSANWALPGHGDAWTDGVPEALRLIRAAWAKRAA